jgi:hypothetical protein
MLLVELFEPKATKEKIPKSKGALGAGAVATVYPHETDPHMVVKKEKSHKSSRELGRFGIHSRNDAFAYFVDVAAPHMSSNPFLPRVYVKNARKSKNGIVSYTYVIERLVERFDSNLINKTVLDSMAEQLLADPYIIQRQASVSMKWQLICEAISKAIEHGKYNILKDENLIEVGRLIWQAVDKFKDDWPQQDANIKVDLHSGNFMFRPTPYGVQLVITDPLYSH